jgi:hypothetical protein
VTLLVIVLYITSNVILTEEFTVDLGSPLFVTSIRCIPVKYALG